MKNPRLAGLAATFTLLALTVGVPAALTTLGYGPNALIDSTVRANLLEPDDGQVLLTLAGALAWVAWAVLAALVLVEIVAAVRGLRAPRLGGMRAPQGVIRNLVTTAALLFTSVPMAAHGVTPTAATSLQRVDTGEVPVLFAASPIADAVSGPTSTPATLPGSLPASAPAPAPTPTPVEGTVPYTVMRGDSLWKIAREQLGDPMRLREIIDLNPQALAVDPDFLLPGTVLLVPAPGPAPAPASASTGTYVVQPGDTLSQIAKNELGSADRYPEIYEASRGIVQPDGHTITDPDLIHPGDLLALSDTQAEQQVGEPATPVTNEPATPPPAKEGSEDGNASDPPPEPAPAPANGPATPSGEHSTEHPGAQAPASPLHENRSGVDGDTTDTSSDHQSESAPAWVLPGLTGAGTLLAAALFIAVRGRRLTQARFRKPGEVLAPPPRELLNVDRTVRTIGAETANRVLALDTMLRELASAYDDLQDLPQVLAVELDANDVRLHLAVNTTLPAPWTGSGTLWTAPLPEASARSAGIAPYPMLVTVGTSDDHHLWLLNLEHIGTLVVTGDPTNAEAMGRSVAAELGINPWATLVDVHTVGLGEELTGIDPARFHHHTTANSTVPGQITAALTLDGQVLDHDPDAFLALVATTPAIDKEALATVCQAVAAHPARPGVTVVVVGSPAPNPDAITAHVDADRHVRIDALGLELTAVGLTHDEALASAGLAEAAENAQTIPYPTRDDETDPVLAMANTAGELRPEHTRPRPVDPADPAGPTLLLPLAADQYLASAPTAVEDLAALAPVVPPKTSRQIEAATDTLDADLAAWHLGNDCPRPRLGLLGEVFASGPGTQQAAAKRRPFLTAVLGYLYLHPNGSTSAELAHFGGDHLRVLMSDLRNWLGTNPRTGTPFLPTARQTRAAKLAGAPRYQVDDVLCDWDLFQRLRVRAQGRGGDAGIADLATALSLVRGVPFSKKHERAWAWLDESDRIDLIAQAAIVDVAQTVGTHALANGDLALARTAADAAITAAPDDEVARILNAEVFAAEGHAAIANRLIETRIEKRADDGRPPVDLPERTAKILKARRGTRGY